MKRLNIMNTEVYLRQNALTQKEAIGCPLKSGILGINIICGIGIFRFGWCLL